MAEISVPGSGQREAPYLYQVNVFEPHRNVTIRAAIAVIEPVTIGS